SSGPALACRIHGTGSNADEERPGIGSKDINAPTAIAATGIPVQAVRNHFIPRLTTIDLLGRNPYCSRTVALMGGNYAGYLMIEPDHRFGTAETNRSNCG